MTDTVSSIMKMPKIYLKKVIPNKFNNFSSENGTVDVSMSEALLETQQTMLNKIRKQNYKM